MLSGASTASPQRSEDCDVVVIGAGLAGLSAAHQLTAAGLKVTVLEASEEWGGRMRTEQVEGFRLDRGGQLLCRDWPELTWESGLAGLALRPFAPGAVLRGADRSVRIGGARSLRVGGGTGGARPRARALAEALDSVRLRHQLSRLAGTPLARLEQRTELPGEQALAARGVPHRTIDGLLRPLTAALLGDPELTTSSRVVDQALRAFARRGLCLPAGGSQSLPDLLAAALPAGTVRAGVRAVSVAVNAVESEAHGRFQCRAVLLASGAQDAAGLLPGLRVPEYHPMTVLHHAAETAPPGNEPALTSLLLDGERRGPVAYSMVASAVDPSRALPGRTLVTSVVLGGSAREAVGSLDRAARPQLAALHGAPAERWELLAAYQDHDAVAAMPAPHDLRRPVRVVSGLYVCGEHRDTSTVQGALRSARRASAAICRDFGLPTAPPAALRMVA